MPWCWQMLAPPHSLHVLLWRWCGQMLAPALLACASSALVLAEACPPHSLHALLRRWCWQMLAPPHSLHWLLLRWCSQMPAPPHSLHMLLTRWCGHRPPLRVAPSAVAPAVAPDPLRRARVAILLPVCVPPASRLAPASLAASASIFVQRSNISLLTILTYPTAKPWQLPLSHTHTHP